MSSMYDYFKRARSDADNNPQQGASNSRARIEIKLDELPIDPGKRKSIWEFHANNRDEVRKFYLQKGPCQPNIDFPRKENGGQKRKFVYYWFKEHPFWLEYSVSQDSAYCLCCYLFKQERGCQSGGDTFVSTGFSNWKNALMKFRLHVGDQDSIHNSCVQSCQALMNPEQHIGVCLKPQSETSLRQYRTRLIASIDVARLCLSQALAFRGHDESEESLNRGNFLTFLRFLADHNVEIAKVVLDKAPENNKLTSPDIQKDIVKAMAIETTKIILQDLDEDDLFSILVDESRDISVKEQMVVLLRFLNKSGSIVECFLGAVHVGDTTSLTLKVAIEELLLRHGLSLERIRGQGYDGASNMSGEFKGLKSLILNENPKAFYVHCFAHQLQLALIGVVKKDRKIAMFFVQVTMIINVVAGSCRRQDLLRDKQTEEVLKGICNGEIETGKGLNQEMTLKRAGETRWGSHYRTLLSLIQLWNPTVSVLNHIVENSKDRDLQGQAELCLCNMSHFDFVFFTHLMKDLLGAADGLSRVLQRSDQDIVGAVKQVTTTKEALMTMRNEGWDAFLETVNLFCQTHNIPIVEMDANFVDPRTGQVLRSTPLKLSNLQYYQYDKFNGTIGLQWRELNERFDEIGTKLLNCMACFDPQFSFCAFDKWKLIDFAKLYLDDFSPINIMELEWALPTYFMDVSSDERFSRLNGIAELGQKMVETRKHLIHPLVFSLLKLALLLPVATASVERSFSAMHLVKTKLRNRIGDDWLNDLLVAYIEREAFLKVNIGKVIDTFQKTKDRRIVLPATIIKELM